MKRSGTSATQNSKMLDRLRKAELINSYFESVFSNKNMFYQEIMMSWMEFSDSLFLSMICMNLVIGNA